MTLDGGFKYLYSTDYERIRTPSFSDTDQILLEMQKQINNLLNNQNQIASLSCKKVLDKNANCNYPDDLVFTVKQYATFKKIEGASFINTLSKRAAQYYRLAKQSDPLTNRRNQVIYKGSDILYLDEALKSILDLD